VVFSRRRARLIVTTGRRHRAHRLRPGSSRRALRRAYPRRRRIARRLYVARLGSRLLIGVGRHRVRYLAVADRRVRTVRLLRLVKLVN
jgi:hypothetical protein